MLSPKCFLSTQPHMHNTLLTCKNSHTDARPTHHTHTHTHTHTQLGHGFYSAKRLKGVIPSHRPLTVPRREKSRFPHL